MIKSIFSFSLTVVVIATIDGLLPGERVSVVATTEAVKRRAINNCDLPLADMMLGHWDKFEQKILPIFDNLSSQRCWQSS